MRVAVAFELEDSDKHEIAGENRDPNSASLDLRANPRAIDQLELARRHPPLRGFLAAVNSADSIFSTICCGTELHPGESAAVTSGEEAYEFTSSIELVFARDEFNFGLGRYQSLAQRLAELLGREATAEALRAELRLRHRGFPASGRKGFSLTLLLYARGATPGQAELRWGLGLARLQQALLFLSRVIRHELSQGS